MEIIDGKKVAAEIKESIKVEVASLLDQGKKAPHLAAVLVGDDPASHTYVAGKEKACHEVGFISSVYKLPASTKEADLLKVVEFLNNDDEVDGFIVQVPLPKHINETKILEAISPSKDVDGFHPANLGRMVTGLPTFLPATPFGILKLLEYYKIETEGKHCVVLGRSNIVGTPMSLLMSRKAYPGNCTVTICHTKTQNVKEICLTADILIAAVGQPNYVTEDMVKEGAVVIDVGMHRIPDEFKKSGFHLTGDVDFEKVAPKCKAISPVPGGVGPMTIVALIMNTFKAYKKEVY
ncbi:MAG: bifunctional methylenetetrahydrofolate dehydrogenase/methenyltetrahydrofolate cyclohydrolase FolD [Bacteroidota bacterium]|nr:bifunctional methylenetetrahydrofolate dehydrogenase/methenyltetrahydrofolate cyclohydrolase FolD [Bacteroidota bacterium]